MPGFPGFDPLDPTADMFRETGFSVGFVAHEGTRYSMRVGGLGNGFDVAIGDKMAMAQAAGELSNMGAYSLFEDKKSMRAIQDATANDESHATPSSVLAMLFQNNDMERIVIDIPAPDASLFESDGVSLKPVTDATVGTLIQDFITAAESAINSTWVPNNSYAFVRGVRRSRKVKLAGGQGALPQVAEGSGATEGPAA